MSRFFLRVSFYMIAHLLSVHLCGQERVPGKREKDGWAIQIGGGIMYGGNIGLLTERQIFLKQKFRFTPFFSTGIGEAGTDSITSTRHYWLGYAAGLNLEYGIKHRIFIGPHFEGNSVLGRSDHFKKTYFSGIGTIIGYKGTSRIGLIWLVYIGNFYSPDDDPFSADKSCDHRSQFGLGLGYKF